MRHHQTYIAGVKFRKGAREILDAMPEGTELRLEREPSNGFDPFAVKVLTQDGRHVGYIPATLSRDVTNLIHQRRVACAILQAGTRLHVYFEEVDDGPAQDDQEPANPSPRWPGDEEEPA